MIGLLTPYKVSNFGTKLQAYAVQQVISTFGEVEVINYEPTIADRLIHKPESMRNMRFVDVKQPPSARGKTDDALVHARSLALNSFDETLNRTGLLKGKTSLSQHARCYQAVVCGSDQIWNPVNLNRHIFMLEFAPQDARKVAFSPSFGIDVLPSSLRQTYRRRLANLDFLSVREHSGVDILASLGFGGVPQTLDPTLMLTSQQWAALEQRHTQLPATTEKYLFCYFLGNRKPERDIARIIATSKGLPLVTIPHFKGYVKWDEDFGDIDLGCVTPQEFIWLIHHAQCVCTDSFHGSAFSALFERDLYCCPRHDPHDSGSTNSRVHSLYESLNLEQRIVWDQSQVSVALQEAIDHSSVQDALARLRSKTWTYLQQALGDLP